MRATSSELLRFATAGSVDDGKSTLIGRLLYDTKAIFEDQLAQVASASERRHGANGNGNGHVDLSLLTDGLRAEREQGITIDVAYRYFTTPRRSFIIADTPGHVRYTRNMVTGASTADLALVLVDARNGVVEQSRRHAFIASLLGIPHLVVCVNKMDLVGWDEEVFDEIVRDFAGFAAGLDVRDVTFIPVSALHGDNVVERSEHMRWYAGPSLLTHLEEVHIASDRNLDDARLPVQWVVRDGAADFRGYAGQVAGGILRPGDDVVVLPSGERSRVAAIETFDGPVAEAFAPMSVTVRLEDELDVSRGDLICRPHDRALVGRDVEATVCWMSETPSAPGGRYLLKHTTRATRAALTGVVARIDVDTLANDAGAARLQLNDIGRVTLRTATPLAFDPYARNRATGSFILVDEATNDTVAAGMLAAPAGAPRGRAVPAELTRERRWELLGVRGATVWFGGRDAVTVARALEARLVADGVSAYVLDRSGQAAEALADAGTIALVAQATTSVGERDAAREAHARAGLDFVELGDASAEDARAVLVERGVLPG